MKRIQTLSLLLACTALPLAAQTAKQQAGIDEDKKSIAGYAKSLNVTCGSNITVTTDYSSYKAVGGVDEDNHAPWHDCRNAIDTVDLVCRDADAEKSAVQKKIGKISCGYAPTEQIELKGNELYYRSPIGEGNPTHVKDYLDKHL